MSMRNEGMVVRASRASFALASRHARESLPHETGGILTGWRAGPEVIVYSFLEVRDRDATRSGYWRRESPATRILADYLKATDDSDLGYVGEWHSHPRLLPASKTDIASLKAIAMQVRAPIALVVLMVDQIQGVVSADTSIAARGPFFRTAVSSVALNLH